ncbi:MAG: hypothetical protein RLZZ301_63 [Bacteroidota bacterium]|jgi:hypothetical protein
MKSIFVALFFCCFTQFEARAQVSDPENFPPESEWKYFVTKSNDSLIEVMKLYFLSNDTLFFREAKSQKLYKLALTDLKTPTFYLGYDYQFAQRFYGPGTENTPTTSRNKKLDRFYYYYLNSPELPITKAQVLTSKPEPIKETQAPEKQVEQQTNELNLSGQAPTSVANFRLDSPVIVLKNGSQIAVETFYFWSNEALFFKTKSSDITYRIDTNQVAQLVGIELGKNLALKYKTKNGLQNGRALCFYGIIGAILLTPTTAIAVYNEYQSLSAVFSAAATLFSTAELTVYGVKVIQNAKRYRDAVRYIPD